MRRPVQKLGHLEKIRKNWQLLDLNPGPPVRALAGLSPAVLGVSPINEENHIERRE